MNTTVNFTSRSGKISLFLFVCYKWNVPKNIKGHLSFVLNTHTVIKPYIAKSVMSRVYGFMTNNNRL
jgi:hypothetical protein